MLTDTKVEGQFFNLNLGLLLQLTCLMVGRFYVLNLWQGSLCVFYYFFKKKKTGTNLEPKETSCLPQHFKYYVRIWLSFPKHSNFFFSSWFQHSSVPRDPSQANNGSQVVLRVCCVDSDKCRVILLFFKAVTSLAPEQLRLPAKHLKSSHTKI